MELISEPAEISFTLTITRKDTGKVEVVNMIGHVIEQKVLKNNEILENE